MTDTTVNELGMVVEDTPEGSSFQRVDLTPYKAALNQLGKNQAGTIVVDTGTMNDKNRGELELQHERNMRRAASELGIGLRMGHTHLPSGKTRIRFAKGEKRTFSQEAQIKRDAALLKGRANRGADKLLLEHPDWDRERALKHWHSEYQKQQKAKAANATKVANAT